jgi:hypothetical protein
VVIESPHDVGGFNPGLGLGEPSAVLLEHRRQLGPTCGVVRPGDRAPELFLEAADEPPHERGTVLGVQHDARGQAGDAHGCRLLITARRAMSKAKPANIVIPNPRKNWTAICCMAGLLVVMG